MNVSVSAWDTMNAANRFEHLDSVKNESVTMRVELPEQLKGFKKFSVIQHQVLIIGFNLVLNKTVPYP